MSGPRHTATRKKRREGAVRKHKKTINIMIIVEPFLLEK